MNNSAEVVRERPAVHGRACQSKRFWDCEDQPRRRKAQIFSLLTLATGVSYLVWLSWAHNPDHPMASFIFMLAEYCCLGLFFLATVGLWKLRFKPPQGLSPDRPYTVDVFVPTYNEPPHYLRKTLSHVSRIEWTGPLAVYVLDDSGRPLVEEMAREFGFNYLSRPQAGAPRVNAKAGNLNFGLARSSGELILVMDADQAPRPEILTAMAGYLRFPNVAFVQSKQSYLVPEGDPFYNRSQVFYDVVQLGLDDNDSVISCGTGVVYRREALESIGGFVEWNIVEDLTTSYELHSKGWKSFYFPHVLSRGLSPASITEVYQQRGQWALDTMRLFFWDNPLLKKGLPWRSRIAYVTVATSYICSAFVFPFFYLIPIWTYLTGAAVLTRMEYEFAAIRLIYFLFMTLAIHYLCHGHQPGKQFRMLAGLFPVYLSGIVRALKYPKGRKPGYCVNNAATSTCGRKKTLTRWRAVLPQTVILLLNLVMPFFALVWRTADPRLILSSACISSFAIWSMSAVVMAAFAPTRYGPDDDPERFYADSDAF